MLSVEERVIRTIGKVAKDIEIRSDSSFEELELDSFAAIEVVFELEEEFDIAIPDDDMQSMQGIPDVMKAIHGLSAEGEDGAS